MLVYRVENESGDGPYTGYPYTSLSRTSTKRHPSPKDDELKFRSFVDEWAHFGFKNIDQLLKWFNTKERKEMHELGYKLVVFESDTIIEGKNQLVFERTGNPIKTVSLYPLIRSKIEERAA